MNYYLLRHDGSNKIAVIASILKWNHSTEWIAAVSDFKIIYKDAHVTAIGLEAVMKNVNKKRIVSEKTLIKQILSDTGG